MKLMIVEDDKALAKGIELALSEKENEITVCHDLKTAEEMWESENADLVILDVNLPDGSGYDFLAFVKESSKVPVILLTANDLEIDQVTGLSLGADDYITKPFSLAVLRARIEVQKRRIREQRENQSIKSILPNCYVIENLKFDFERLCFFKGEEELSLSRNEQKLLQIFLKNQGRILTREILMERLWQDGAEFVDENALSVTINRLRKKIEGGTKYIQTVKAMSGGKKSDKKVIWRRRNWKRLNQMLDEGIRGEFEESKYDESELSKVESKWKRFLQDSAMAKQNLETEKANIKGLISDISHQTKTPMANIKLYSELLSEQLEEDGMEAELLGQIQAQAQKLEFLIQALTKLSRLETNILEVVPVKSQVKPLLESAVEEIRKKAEKKEIQIKIEMDFEAEAVFDRKWTEEALYNLLDNAVKYSPAGSEVLISTKLYEMWCVIAVSDRGRGISEEEIPKIFGRFYRAKEVQQEEGVGIGLYLVREILQKEGGFIKVNSEVGKGSTFLCYLPR